MNFYSTNALQAVARNLKVPPTFLLNTFFTTIAEFTTEEISFDIELGKRRVSPFVHPLSPSRRVDDPGIQTDTFVPAYIKDKRELNPNEALKRSAGESIGGSLSPQERVVRMIEAKMLDQVQMLNRRLEVMAAQALLNGQVVVDGPDYPARTVSFGRAGGHTVNLTLGERWSQTSTSDPEKDFETWESMILDETGMGATNVVMDNLAFGYFRNHPKVEKRLDVRRIDQENMRLTLGQKMEGAVFQGYFGPFAIWTYRGWYVNDAGSQVKIFPDNTALMVGDAIEGVQSYGAIRDLKGLAAGKTFFKSWEEEDPSVRWLLLQSAPLVYPKRPNATIKATIHS